MITEAAVVIAPPASQGTGHVPGAQVLSVPLAWPPGGTNNLTGAALGARSRDVVAEPGNEGTRGCLWPKGGVRSQQRGWAQQSAREGSGPCCPVQSRGRPWVRDPGPWEETGRH